MRNPHLCINSGIIILEFVKILKYETYQDFPDLPVNIRILIKILLIQQLNPI